MVLAISKSTLSGDSSYIASYGITDGANKSLQGARIQ